MSWGLESYRSHLRRLQARAATLVATGKPVPEWLVMELMKFGWLAGEEE